jgi:hypothetical protein
VAQTRDKDLPIHLKNWWEWTTQRGVENTKLHFQKSRQTVTCKHNLQDRKARKARGNQTSSTVLKEN